MRNSSDKIQGITDTASKILYLLRKSENGLTTEDLCNALRVTPMAVHRPITLLEGKGLVNSEIFREKKKGRPVRVYKIAENCDEFFPKNYSGLIIELLDQLNESEGLGRVRELLESIFKKRVKITRNEMKGKNLRSRVETVSKILAENDYMPEQKEVNDKKFVLKLFNCPISKVAKTYPQTCSCEQHFLSDLIQADVQRDHHILNGENYCSYVVQRKA